MKRDDEAVGGGEGPAAATFGSTTRLLIAGLLTFMTVFGLSRFLYTPLLPIMQKEFGFGVDIAALLASSNLAAYVAASFAATFFSTSPHRVAIFRVAMIASVAATIGMGLVSDPWAWVVFRVVAGLASAFGFIIAATIVGENLAAIQDEGRSGWVYAGNGAAMALSGLFVAPANLYLSSSQIWIAVGVVAGLALPFVFKEMRTQTLPVRTRKFERVRHQPRPFPFWSLFAAYTISGIGFTIYSTFIVALIKTRPGQELLADWVWIVAGLVAIPSGVASAWCAERIGFAKALLVTYLLLAIGIILPGLTENPVAALLSAVLFGISFVSTAVLALPLGRNGMRGRGLGIMTIGGGLGQVLGPIIAAKVAGGTSDLSLALYVGGVTSLVAVAIFALGFIGRGRASV